MSNNRNKNACIIVLGDIGRSPRMQYHAQSLLEENYNVNIVGYLETKPIDCLLTVGRKCKIHELSQVPLTNFPPKLKYIFKTIWQTLSLLIALLSIPRPSFILVQNPPAVPTFVVCYIYCTFTRSKFIIDWHNYTYSILALATNEKSLIVRLARWIERHFGSKASANFCVTKAMKNDLETNWGIKSAIVLYDRPPTQFKSIDLNKKHELFMKLSKEYSEFLPKNCSDFKESGVIESTALTQKTNNGNIIHKSSRPAILVSSTSWTPDEDFCILLKALEEYEMITSSIPNKYPNLLCIITGKGPQKDFYIDKINKLNWSKVTIITPWLEIEDYPTILAAADLGVCLHWSSSGFDLPMKVVDMFGCGLPVCALNFNCLNELIMHEKNGYVFENQDELAEQLLHWFEDYPNNASLLNTKEIFQNNLRQFQTLRWKENWTKNALPIFESLSN